MGCYYTVKLKQYTERNRWMWSLYEHDDDSPAIHPYMVAAGWARSKKAALRKAKRQVAKRRKASTYTNEETVSL